MNWLSGQYHQTWNTTDQADGNYLLVLELFGPGGARIKPNGAPAGDPGAARAFQFRRWEAPGDTANVPFADCAHVFRINNTHVVGDIVDLRKNHIASGDECQFMSGPGATTFSAGFRAYHDDGVTTGGGPGDTNSFMRGYSLTWQRGLNGPSGTVEAGTADKGELAVAELNALAFSYLLGPFPPTRPPHHCSSRRRRGAPSRSTCTSTPSTTMAGRSSTRTTTMRRRRSRLNRPERLPRRRMRERAAGSAPAAAPAAKARGFRSCLPRGARWPGRRDRPGRRNHPHNCRSRYRPCRLRRRPVGLEFCVGQSGPPDIGWAPSCDAPDGPCREWPSGWPSTRRGRAARAGKVPVAGYNATLATLSL